MPLTETIRIVVVDDHALVNAALVTLLDGSPDLAVVGTFMHPDQALASLSLRAADVIVLDAVFGSDRTSGTTVARFRAAVPNVPILMLSGHPDDNVIAAALSAGASGFVRKSDSPETLVEAIRAVAAGSKLPRAELNVATPVEELRHLTVREIDVLLRVIDGLSNAEVAADLGIATSTVRNHVSAVLQALNLRDRKALIRWGVQRHLSH